ncbi:NUDIX hydrolase domain-like protein [Aspergillus bertholletiae]|uniref:NUDIX hydrolase domain-like protein n=1 Tax=Aspergillus bertholletiae TaxID=1226010 RepID=A0A5N7B2H2_9EURO|nr:NUDIX hydrolase domain-like protein [Aspergillus bertholletiae]
MDPEGKQVVSKGVYVFIFNSQNAFLMGLREGSPGAGTWGLPGADLEALETPVDCAKDGVEAETGLTITLPKILTYINDIFQKDKAHYSHFLAACAADQTPVLMDPDTCKEWKWFSLDEVRKIFKAQDAAERKGTIAKYTRNKLFLPAMALFGRNPKFDPHEAYKLALETGTTDFEVSLKQRSSSPPLFS